MAYGGGCVWMGANADPFGIFQVKMNSEQVNHRQIPLSIDGRLAYPSTGDVIDVRTKQIVRTLQDEHGVNAQSEKLLEIDFANGTPVIAGDQFGKGKKR